MAEQAEKIPSFPLPSSKESPIINSLLNEKFYIESGLSYYKYKCLNPVDPLELSKSNSVAFLWRCESSFLNTKRVFVEVKWYATNAANEALIPSNFVGGSIPSCHMLLDTCGINIGEHIETNGQTDSQTDRQTDPARHLNFPPPIGECALDENSKFYPLLAKMGYLMYYSEAARRTFLS